MGKGYIIKIFLLGLFIVLINPKIRAKEYFVSNVAEFNALSLNPGDVVILKNGVWEGAFLEFEGVGTESNPITLKAETSGEVYFTGKSSMEIGGEYLIVDGFVFTQGSIADGGHVIRFQSSSSNQAYHCRLTNTKIYNYNPPGSSTEYKWVSLHGQYNRVDHCHFEGKNHAGAMMVVWLDDQPNYHQIDSNYFGPRPDLGVNGGETIRIGTSDWSMFNSHTIVEGNLFDECDGEIEIISNKSCKNVYRYNTFRNSEGTLTLRHGNECEVYSNFFFGASDKNSGGIRIIGENHKVYNNYLQDIPGSGFRGAISIVNGVPDSPLNRYFQVINAEVVNNTIVNCDHPMVVGAGADSELSLPPKDCFIANNVVAVYSSSTSKMIEYVDVPENMTYQNNVMYGTDLGIADQTGITIIDPELTEGDIWRPSVTSAVVGNGTSAYSYVTNDIDLHARSTTNDVGCDQVSSDPIKNAPLEKGDVGVKWSSSIKEVSAVEGGAKLIELIDSANDGDVIVLTTSGGIYEISQSAQLTKDIKVRADFDLEEKPVIKASGQVEEFISLLENSNILLEGIEIDGSGDDSNSLKHIFKVYSESYLNDTHTIIIDNCFFYDFPETNSESLFTICPGAVISEFNMTNTQVFDVSKETVSFDQWAYAIDLQITNCSFINIGREVLKMNCEEAGNSTVVINHCTIDSVGFDSPGYAVFELQNVDASIDNSIFSNCGTDEASFDIFGENSSVDYSIFWQSAKPNAFESARLGDSIWTEYDPLFASRVYKEYTLLPGSYAFNRADDNNNLGDLYWEISNGHLNNNALLSDLQVDNNSVDFFDPFFFEYHSIIADTSSYFISALPQDDNAITVVDYPAEIPGDAYIEVTAENMINKNYYKISLESLTSNIKSMSDNELFSVYPNPSQGNITIRSGISGTIFIYNAVGKLVASSKIISSEMEMNLSALSAGTYEVILQSISQTLRMPLALIN